MKSGTNQFHGSLEDRYLNGRLVHRQYFEQLKRCQPSAFSNTIIPCNPFTYHEMGATAGGPITIPKLYNGKDKTFFFAGFQRHHEKVTETFIGNVPSPDMYAGDFNFGGRGFPIYDPATTRLENGTWIRDPFPGNVIPQNRYDPVAKNILARNPWKAPNDPGTLTPSGPTNNLVVPTKGRYYITRWDGKVITSSTPTTRCSAVTRKTASARRAAFPTNYSGRWWTPVYVTPIDLHNLVLSDTHTFSPTIINEARFGWNTRNQTNSPPTTDGDWAKQLGIPNVSPVSFPDILNGGGGRYYNLGPGGFSERRGADTSFQDNVTKIVAKHTVKFGYELVRTTYDSLVETFPSGRYNLGGTDFPFRTNTGNQFANFLLGQVSVATFTQAQAHWQPRWWSHSFYVQDDYKPVRNLTINFGVRWSYESPFQTADGKQAQFDPTVTDPLTGHKGRDCPRPWRARQKGPQQLPASHRRGVQLQAEVGVPRQLRHDHGRPAHLHSQQQLRRIPGHCQPSGASGRSAHDLCAFAGSAVIQVQLEPGRFGPVHRNQLQRAQRHMVRSQHADAVHVELVWRLPVSDVQQLAHGSPLSGFIGCRATQQLGHQRRAFECLNRSRSTDDDSQFLSELQALSAVRKHPALFQLRPQHVITG